MAHTFKTESSVGDPEGDSSGDPGGAERLSAALERLDRLVDWERRDRSAGAARAMRVSLAPAADLAARAGDPQLAFRALHVAGTKGKGSVAALVAAAARRAGVRTGVYASPHVERVNERVRVDGAPLGDEALAVALERALDLLADAGRAGTAGADATWFDVLTVAAFLAFAEAGVELAVVECGLGGRLDSTNVLPPGPCVVTNVELEHTAILGSTRAAIAAEKAGILKSGGSCVSAVGPPEDEAQAVVERLAAERGVPVTRVALDPRATIEARNVALATAALAELERVGSVPRGTAGRLDEEAIAAARLPGRLERWRIGAVPLVLDGAHTPGSVRAVLRELEADSDLPGRPTVLLGLGRDKDAAGILKVLVGGVDRLLCTSVGAGPYRDPEDLLELAQRAGLVAETVTSPRAGLTHALDTVSSPGWILVVGSLHLVGAVRPEVRSLEGTAC